MDAAAQANEGWFPDPVASAPPGALRWWDGTAWTEHVHVPSPPAPAPSAVVDGWEPKDPSEINRAAAAERRESQRAARRALPQRTWWDEFDAGMPAVVCALAAWFFPVFFGSLPYAVAGIVLGIVGYREASRTDDVRELVLSAGAVLLCVVILLPFG